MHCYVAWHASALATPTHGVITAFVRHIMTCLWSFAKRLGRRQRRTQIQKVGGYGSPCCVVFPTSCSLSLSGWYQRPCFFSYWSLVSAYYDVGCHASATYQNILWGPAEFRRFHGTVCHEHTLSRVDLAISIQVSIEDPSLPAGTAKFFQHRSALLWLLGDFDAAYK